MCSALNSTPDVIRTVNRYTEAYAPIVHATGTWLQALIDDATANIPWLRNDIFSIAVFSFAEGIVNYRNIRGNVLADARKLGLSLMVEYVEYTDALTDELEKLLLLFNAQEHQFLNCMRHQNVHGKWTMTKEEDRRVPVPEQGRLKMVKVDNDTYQVNARHFVENDHHAAVSEMRERFSSYRTLFWMLDNAFRLAEREGYIANDIACRETRRFRLAGLKNPAEEALMTLHEFKERADANQRASRPISAA